MLCPQGYSVPSALINASKERRIGARMVGSTTPDQWRHTHEFAGYSFDEILQMAIESGAEVERVP
jgi:hypothetical protein